MIRTRYTVRYCDLCKRQTCHTSIDYGRYHCNNCSRGFCEVPVCPVGSASFPNMLYEND